MSSLLLFDVDSTLINEEVIDLLAKHAGVSDTVKSITERAMAGEIDFDTALNERVALLSGLPRSPIGPKHPASISNLHSPHQSFSVYSHQQ